MSGPNQSYALVFGGILAVSVVVPALMTMLRERVIKRRPIFKDAWFSPTVFSFVTSLYAFFLGFAVVTLWTAFQNTRTEVTLEAASVLAAHQLSYGLPNAAPLRQALQEYAESVVQDEWPRMDATDTLSPRTGEKWNTVWSRFVSLRPTDKADNSLYASLAASLAEVARHRLARSLLISGNLYPPIWVILWFGAVAIMVGLLFSNLKQEFVQAIIEGVTLFLVLSCIFFIADLDTPFSGYVKIDPEAFQSTLASMAGSFGGQ